MRGIVVMSLFVASLAYADWNEYSEIRKQRLEAAGISTVSIDVGAGSLVVEGAAGAGEIEVTAVIEVETGDEEKAARIIAEQLVFELERKGDRAALKAYFDGSGLNWDDNGRVNVEVVMPAGLPLEVNDGSGSIEIRGTTADIRIDDGSGSIGIEDAGNVIVDDGSGSVDIARASGDVSVNDGSGSINIRDVQGSVTIDDGSGSIRVDGVGQDLIIIDDGSGSLDYANVQGRVETDD